MRVSIINFSFIIVLISTLCASCTDDMADMAEPTINKELVELYRKYSTKPVKSVLGVALCDNTRTGDTVESIYGLTSEEGQHIMSMNPEELEAFKDQIKNGWGISAEEELEIIKDNNYEALYDALGEDDFIALDNFIEKYLNMPPGLGSIEAAAENERLALNPELYVNAAVCIDSFGRVLYENIQDTRVSPSICKKYFASRIAITSLNMLAGMVLGGDPVIAVMAVLDVAGATADYYRCMKNP